MGELPVIAMTAHALIDDRRKFLAAGMNDHISKPLDPRVMARILGDWLEVAPVASHQSAFPLDTGNPRWSVQPTVGVEWLSEDYADYYDGGGATGSGRTGGSIVAYQGDDSFNPYFKDSTYYLLSERWSLVSNAKYRWLDGNIVDNAMVEDANGQLLLGVSYRF